MDIDFFNTLLNEINIGIENNKFGFRTENYEPIRKKLLPDLSVDKSNQLIYGLGCLIYKIKNKQMSLSLLEKKRIKNSNIKEPDFAKFTRSIYTDILDMSFNMSVDMLVKNIQENLFIDFPHMIIEEYFNTSNKYSWLFNIPKQQYSETLSGKIIKLILFTLYDDIVITFENIQFVVLSIYYNDTIKRNCINLLSSNSDKKNFPINYLSYYYSNSEMGLMRFMANYTRSDRSVMLAKYLDYATETLIDFKLQEQINTKIVNFDTCIKNYKMFDPLEWNDNINLNLLNIIRTEKNEYVEKRGFMCPFLYCFSTTLCGQIFSENYYRNIIEVNEIMNNFLRIIRSNPNNKLTYDSFLKNTHNHNYILDNFILFNDLKKSKEKIKKLIDHTNYAKSQVIDIISLSEDQVNYKTTDYLSIHYQMLGKMLNTIIDNIIGEQKNIYENSYELNGFLGVKFRFNININIMIIQIDCVNYHMYWSEYTIKKIIGLSIGDFDPSILNYKSILKIVPAEHDIIIESGVDNCFTIAGSLQCKPIEYIDQLSAVLDNLPIKPDRSDSNYLTEKTKYLDKFKKRAEEDKNFLNTEYYFIGKHVNEMFSPECFSKFYCYTKNDNFLSLKNKYIKYKNKYINVKNKK
jgi:hypothetical protein